MTKGVDYTLSADGFLITAINCTSRSYPKFLQFGCKNLFTGIMVLPHSNYVFNYGLYFRIGSSLISTYSDWFMLLSPEEKSISLSYMDLWN